MSSLPVANVTDRRRQLNDAQWLQAMGIDPFWIEGPADQRFAPTVATAEAKAASRSGSQVTEAAALSVSVGQPTREDINSWATLETTIRECRACGLCQGRKQAVPGSGDRQATWLMVGEAPGAEEDAAGQPFVGKAGKLLDAILAALDLNRQAGVYIANAVKCRPPENRTPERAEIDACNHFLNQQIEQIQPEVIVALGKPAAYAVLGQEASIQSLRGSIHVRAQGGRQIPVIVSYHPAYLLRQPEEKWKSWQDLLLAQSALGNP